MPPPQQSWFKPGLRYCGSCLVSLLYWAVWLTFGATLAVLVYIAIARELPVPDFVLRRVETQFAEANLSLKFGRARLDPSGKILLEDTRLRSRQFEEPLLISRLLYVRRSIWSILAGRPIPDEIRLEGATLQLPAILSPSGTAEPVVRDLATTLRHDDNNVWHVDQLTGRIGRLKITLQGDFSPPRHLAGSKQPSPDEIIARFLQIGRRLILEVSHFEAFDDPALDIHLETQPGIGNTALCRFTAGGAHEPWGKSGTLGALAVTTTLRLDGRGERAVRLHATVRNFSQRDQYSVENLRAMISARIVPETFSVRPVDALLAAGSLSADDERVAAPLLKADLRAWPEVKAAIALQMGGEFVTAEVDANLDQQSAQIAAEGSGSPAIINRVLAKHTPRAAPYFVFGDPVTFVAEAELSPGWHFKQLATRVATGRLNSHDVKITSARGRIKIEGTSFLAYEAQVEMGENVARGSYWMDFATTDYRMLLKGRLRPSQISGWFNGDWWTDFWNQRFDFPSVLPEADVDVQGRWKDVSRTEFFGHAQAREASVWGGKFDQVQAMVFLRPFFTHVIEFNGVRANGAQRLGGSLKRFADANSRENRRVEFNLEGNVDPETYHGMLEGKADDVMATLQFSGPPHVHAQGSIEGQGPAPATNYTFTGQSEGSLQYYDFPLEMVRVIGAVKGSEVRLSDIQFTALGGKGAGNAALTGTVEHRRLGFDFYLNGADLGQTVRAVHAYQVNHRASKTEPVPDNEFIKRISGGHLDVALSAQGVPGELTSFVGTGNAALTGANLGEIQLFGLLSQVLSGLSLNFSSLKLDAAHTNFRMENGRLRFPDLKITGSSAVIDAQGDFVFATSALDFTAKFKPFEESRNPLTVAIGFVIKPITSIMELKLTGPLSKPDWSIDVGSSPHLHDTVTPKGKNSDLEAPPTK